MKTRISGMKTRISSKGQIVLPAEFRERDNIRPGEEFFIERKEAGEYSLKRIERPRNEGFVNALLACPVKGWFRPFDRSETTDDIKVPEVG
jgi:AbrB family looped-hinge helix DNA binding protein